MFRIAKSLFAIVAVATIAAGSTSAYFSDQITVAGNTFSSGTLDLKVNGSDTASAIYHSTNLHPLGVTGWGTAPDVAPYVGDATLKNDGSIAGHAWMEITNVVVTGGNGDGSLANRIKPSIAKNGPTYGTIISGLSLNALSAMGKIDIKDLAPAETISVGAYLLWPDSTPAVDNLAQGQTVTFTVVFHLDQI
jgi:predicted ribosomally synthesized peptide with SipW-like signal peptide